MADVEIVSHWYHLIDGLQYSSQAFYDALDASIAKRAIPGASVSRVAFSEGGMFSAKRDYLRVERQGYTFDLCAALFGTGFFVSWWLYTKPGCLTTLGEIPVLGFFVRRFIRPITYWQIDTALMFQEAVRHAVLEVIDAQTETKGIRALSEFERKPIMKDFFRR